MTAKPRSPAVQTWSGVTARRMARHALAEPADGVSPVSLVAGVMEATATLTVGTVTAGPHA